MNRKETPTPHYQGSYRNLVHNEDTLPSLKRDREKLLKIKCRDLMTLRNE